MVSLKNSTLNKEYKLCILGEGGVGKSCLVLRFFSNLIKKNEFLFTKRQYNLFKEFLFQNMIQPLKMFIERFFFSFD